MNEERLRVLQMIESGVVSAAEGATLLGQLVENGAATSSDTPQEKPRQFRVRVSDLQTGKIKINVNIPLDLVEVGLRMGARFVPEWEPTAYAAILQAAHDGKTGQMVEEITDGEKIEIIVE
jgi:hypothetical protein